MKKALVEKGKEAERVDDWKSTGDKLLPAKRVEGRGYGDPEVGEPAFGPSSSGLQQVLRLETTALPVPAYEQHENLSKIA
jgi:hypothetical protein